MKLQIHLAAESMEKARGIDPFGHAGLTPLGKIRLTPFE